MNWNKNSSDDIEDELRRLRPAVSAIDAKEIFYRAGYEAAKQSQRTASGKSVVRWPHLIVAAALTTVLAAPISYRLGQRQGLSTIAQTESDPSNEVAVETPVIAAVQQPAEELQARTESKDLVTPRRSRLSDFLFQSIDQPPSATTLTAFRGSTFSDTDKLNTWMNMVNESQPRKPLGAQQTDDVDADNGAMTTLAVGDTLRSLPRLTN